MPRTTFALFLIAGMAVSGCRNEPGTAVPSGAGTAASTAPAAGGQVASTPGAAAAPLTISRRGPGAKGTADAPQLAVPRTFELTHVAPAHYAAALGKDPARIFAFVRDHIAYEAYPGCLRGPRGTLLAMAGNSVDRAALLHDLLEQSGQKARFARGTLSEEKARELVPSMWSDRRASLEEDPQLAPGVKAAMEILETRIPRDYAQILEQLKKTGQAIPDPEPSVGDLVREAQDHYWIQWEKAGTWTDLDPSFADSIPGQTNTNAERTLAALPDDVHHRVSIRVRLEEYAVTHAGDDPTKPESRVILSYDARAADLSGADLALTHQPENWKGPVGSVQDAVSSAIEASGRVMPTLILDYTWQAGAPFYASLPSAGGLGSVESLLRGAGTRNPVPVATAESVEFDFTSPSGRKETVVRELFDLVGAARRRDGKPLQAAEVRERTAAPSARDHARRIHSVFVTTGGLRAAHLPEPAQNAAGDDEAADVRTALRRLHVMFAATSDGLLERVGHPDRALVRFYLASPRITILDSSEGPGGSRLSIDLRRDRARAVALGPFPKDVFAARILRGVTEVLERVLIELATAEAREQSAAGPALSTSSLFDRVSEDKIATVLMSSGTLCRPPAFQSTRRPVSVRISRPGFSPWRRRRR